MRIIRNVIKVSINSLNCRKIQLVAFTAAIALHGGIAAWAMTSGEPVQIQQQVIKISMVAPSSLAQPKQETAEPTPIARLKPDGMKAKKKPQPKPEELKQQAIVAPPTSGLQAPEAVEKTAAQTEPVFNAAYLNNPAPAYPPSARRKGDEGKVLLQVEVSVQGTAKQVSVARSSGSSTLDEAALSAVRNWKFLPAKRGNEIVEARVIVPVEFKLN